MARIYQWKCSSCDYKYGGAGKPSMLRSGNINTYQCNNCQTLDDHQTSLSEPDYDFGTGELKIQNEDLGPIKCGYCGNEKLVEWSFEERNCPKINCTGKMICDESSLIIAD